jgi:peptidase S41-like protein
MTRFEIKPCWCALLLLAAGPMMARADTKSDGPDYQEVYDLIRAHLAGVSDAELNRAAVQGLINSLSPKVSLAANDSAAPDASDAPLLSKVAVLDSGILYLRVARVAEGLDAAIDGAYQRVASTNRLEGLVLDLRYATGASYPAAAATVDLFVAKAQPLLNWGSGVVSSHEKTNAIRLPVAVLVNRATAGAAEALAAALRETGAALMLGGRTAGQAMIAQSFPLKNGGALRIATAPIALGDGSTMSLKGLEPDIGVAVSAEDERAYFADAFRVVRKSGDAVPGAAVTTNQAGGTNGTRRVRFNEAELVRQHREGIEGEGGAPDRPMLFRSTPDRKTETEVLQVRDPVLGRALDLLRGLAVVRQSRS